MTGETAVRTALPEVGDALVLTGFAGSAGAAALARRYPKRFRERFSYGYLARVFDVEDWLFVERERGILETLPGVTGIVTLGNGGFYRGLWDFMEATGRGVFVRLNDVPILQETVELTDLVRLDPYGLDASGCVLAAVREADGVLAALHRADIPAAVVGEVRKAPEKTVLRDGETVFLRRIRRDELTRMG